MVDRRGQVWTLDGFFTFVVVGPAARTHLRGQFEHLILVLEHKDAWPDMSHVYEDDASTLEKRGWRRIA